MSKGIQRRAPLLTVCLLLSIAPAVHGQHSQTQQSSQASPPQALGRAFATHQQKWLVPHPSTSTIYRNQSDTAVRARFVPRSEQRRHVAPSVHVRSFPTSNAGEGAGTHDFIDGGGTQLQRPSAGRGGAYRAMLALGQQNQRSGLRTRQRLAEQSVSPENDQQAGGEVHRSAQHSPPVQDRRPLSGTEKGWRRNP